MPIPPTTVAAFVETVLKSGLVPPDQLPQRLQQLKEQGIEPEDPTALAQLLVAEGILTDFHVKNLLKGRYRGFVVGKYRVLQPIGSGGMGSVYLCEHTTMGHRVAMKVLPSRQMNDPVSVERFFREARATAQLRHPNIVRAHDIDREENFYYIIMDYVEGVSLQQLVTRHGPLTPVRVAHYVAQAATGLEYIHDSGLLHRDIKPGNLLLDPDGVIKILDLGLARFRDDRGSNLTNLLDERNIIGTADYISPEQAIQSSDVDHRTDFYSLGATAYFLLTGHPPFEGLTPVQKLLAHQNQEPPPIQSHGQKVPANLEAIVRKLMAKNPSDRFQSGSEIVLALALWTDQPIDLPTEEELASELGPVRPASSTGERSTIRKTPPSSSQIGRISSLTRSVRSGLTPSVTAPVARNRSWLYSVVAGLLLGIGAIIYLKLFPGEAPASKVADGNNPPKGGITGEQRRPPNGETETRFFLIHADSERELPSLAEAIREAVPGDRIRIRGRSLQEHLHLQDFNKQIRIEGFSPAEGERVRWTLPPGSEPQPLIELNQVHNVTLTGFRLDGQEHAATLVLLKGFCPGCVLENCEYVGATNRAIHLDGVQGTEMAPVRLVRCRFVDQDMIEAGIEFTGAKTNQFVQIQDCRFEGPLKAAVRITAPLRACEIRRCRFYQTTEGIRYVGTTSPSALGLRIEGNTFFQLTSGIRFDRLPMTAGAFEKVIVRNNLFLQTGRVARHDAVPRVPAHSTAQWIWYKEEDPTQAKGAPPETRYFHHTFDVADPKGLAMLNIGCDDAFVVWINGKRAGESNGKYFTKRVYAFEVGKLLQPGKNTIAVQATNQVDPLNKFFHTSAALLVELINAEGQVLAATNSGWWSTKEVPPNWLDPQFTPKNWTTSCVLPGSNLPWSDVIWESAIEAKLPGGSRPQWLECAGNLRDYESSEGYPLLDAPRGIVRSKPGDPKREVYTNPNADAQFLRYPRSHPLATAGVGGAPIGVPGN